MYMFDVYLYSDNNKQKNIMESQVIVYITDKSKTEMFKNYISELYIDSAKRDLQKQKESS